MAASETNTTTDPYLAAYYNQQGRSIKDNYALNVSQNDENNAVQQQSYTQKLQALQSQLNQQRATLPDSYADRGILNSGIYNYNGGPNNLGAWQQFQANSALSQGDLQAQKALAQQQAVANNQQLKTTTNDQLAGVRAVQAADGVKGAISDALSGV